MNLKVCRRELALDLTSRSTCTVRMAAVLSDRSGRIFSYGWNSVWDGWGLHAEEHAIRRANPRRLEGSRITIAGRRRGLVRSFPCLDRCLPRLIRMGIQKIEWLDKDGTWQEWDL